MTLEDKLEAALARSKEANDRLKAAIRADPDLMKYAGLLLKAAKIAAPIVAGALGGPGAAAIAGLAVQLVDSAEQA